MGLLDELKKLTRPYDDDEDDFDDEPERPVKPAQPTEPPRTASAQTSKNPFSASYSEPAPSATRSYTPSRKDTTVVNLRSGTQSQVVLVKPERFETAAEIADHLRDRRTVILNLEQTNKDIARRLIDFLSGVAYAQDGKIRKAAANTYIITPPNVEIVGDLMDELESSGLYF